MEPKGLKRIIFEKDEETQIATITLNRPAKLNAFDEQMWEEVVSAVDDVDDDDNLKVLIFKGAGSCFSSGYDMIDVLARYGGQTPKPGEKFVQPRVRTRIRVDRHVADREKKIAYCNKFTICQVHGYTLGIGLHFALMSDFTIAAEDATFGHPGFRYVGGGLDSPALLYWLKLGLQWGNYLRFTGDQINAQEAERRGLVLKVVPLDQLDEEVGNLARKLALIPADGVALAKQAQRLMYQASGVEQVWALHEVGHVLQTYLKQEPDELNVFKLMRDKGHGAAFDEFHQRFEDTRSR